MLLSRSVPMARGTGLDPIDRAFQQLTSGFFPSSGWRNGPMVHGAWKGENLELTVDLPGVPREAVSVEVADRVLTIAVEHTTESEQLRWSRSLQLGGSLDPDGVAARYADGRLTVTVPPVTQAPARKVEIAIATPEPSPAIEASEAGDSPSES